jgi:biopolymer transport protein ExbB
VWETLVQGGVVMIPLAICSVLGLTIVLERAISLRTSTVLKKPILDLIDSADLPENLKLARTMCDKNPCAMAAVVRTALDGYGLTREQLRESMVDAGRQEVHKLERGLTILETVAVISPLLGLLGTGFGMIEVFRVVAAQGVGQAQLLSGGISEALITTVTGLTIAIPILVAYNFFSRRVEDLSVAIEHNAVRLLNRLAPGPANGSMEAVHAVHSS